MLEVRSGILRQYELIDVCIKRGFVIENVAFYISTISFIAHLSQRLNGELIVYQ